MKKKNSNTKGCLLAFLIVFFTALAGGMQIYGSTEEKVQNPSDIREMPEIEIQNPSDVRETQKIIKTEDGRTENLTADSNEKIKPALAVAQKAERTQTKTLSKEGKYMGERKAGCYPAGSEVVYEITITNNGNVPVQEICLQEELSEELQACMKKESEEFQARDSKEVLQEGEKLNSSNNKFVTVIQCNAREVIFDCLEPGDSLRLCYRIILEECAASVKPLNSLVQIEGFYRPDPTHRDDSEKVPADEDDRDEESILVIIPRISVHVKTDKTEEQETSKEKRAGWYKPGEAVRFQIVLENSGNVPLCQVELENQFTKELEALLQPEKWEWSQEARPLKGQEREKAAVKNLLPGESVCVQYTVFLGEQAGCLELVEHTVRAMASYNPQQKYAGEQEELSELSAVPGDEDDTDRDGFWICTPRLRLAVHAERTRGVVLHQGRYTGTRVPGVYQVGECVNYTITVTNTGNSDAQQVEIFCKMGEDDPKKEAELNRLEPGESADLIYTVTLEKDAVGQTLLESQVTAGAAGVIPDEDDVDREWIVLAEAEPEETQENRQESGGESNEESSLEDNRKNNVESSLKDSRKNSVESREKIIQKEEQAAVYTGDPNLQDGWFGCLFIFSAFAGLLWYIHKKILKK